MTKPLNPLARFFAAVEWVRLQPRAPFIGPKGGR